METSIKGVSKHHSKLDFFLVLFIFHAKMLQKSLASKGFCGFETKFQKDRNLPGKGDWLPRYILCTEGFEN